MQTTTAAKATNPLLQETSTRGASFWTILASTTGDLPSSDASQNVVRGDTEASRQNAGQESGQDDSADGLSGEKSETRQLPTSQSVVPTIPFGESGASETALLAQRIVSAVTGQSATRRPASTAKPDGASLISSSTTMAMPSAAALAAHLAASTVNTGVFALAEVAKPAQPSSTTLAAIGKSGATPSSPSSDAAEGRTVRATASPDVASTTRLQDAPSGNAPATAPSETGLPPSASGQTALANTLPSVATLAVSESALPLAAPPDPGNQSSQAKPNVASGSHPPVAATTAGAISEPKGTGSDSAVPSDKASHSQASTSGSSGSGQTANAAGNPAAQHSPDPGQAGAAKSPDSGAPLLQATAHEVARGQLLPGHGAEAARATDTPHTATELPVEGQEAPAGGGINTARLIQTMSETGIQVGMRSAEFGDVSIRTMVSQQQMMTQISVDHGDLGRAIAAHVPAIQAKLGDELGMRSAIQVNQTGTSFSGEQGNASGGQQQAYGHRVQSAAIALMAEPEATGFTAGTSDEDRLDIQA